MGFAVTAGIPTAGARDLIRRPRAPGGFAAAATQPGGPVGGQGCDWMTACSAGVAVVPR